MNRAISHSEVATALDCQAKHAFGYTGRLTDGKALSAKTTVPQLRDGRAWGAGVAAWHALGSLDAGRRAILASLQSDRAKMREAGVEPVDAEYTAASFRLVAMLGHHTKTAERLPLVERERELLVPVPSRGGRRASTRYRLHCFLDGVYLDEHGRYWIVEFKLRKRLSSDEQIALSRQTRWYAWAFKRSTGIEVAGVIVDERLNELPGLVRHNANGSVSKVQSCDPDAYVIACMDADQEPDGEVLERLRTKQWEKRTEILFRPDEMWEAGLQLASAANLIRQLDDGVLFPIRNPSPARCPSCQFRQVCDTPWDRVLVDSLFTRVLPKRDRPMLEAA